MKKRFYTSGAKFAAEEIPSQVMGCDGYYYVYNTATNSKIGVFEEDEGVIRFTDTDVSYTTAQLTELATLSIAIYKAKAVK